MSLFIKQQCENSSIAQSAVYLHGTAVSFHDPVDQGKSQTGAGGTGGEERLEQLGQDVLRNTGAVVPESYEPAPVIMDTGCDDQLRLIPAGLEGVSNQILETSADLVRIT
jgi:hypothetical protein